MKKQITKINGALIFTTSSVVASVPDCIRVTMVLADIFGLASSQRTWLNVHTCTCTLTEIQPRPPALRGHLSGRELRVQKDLLLFLSTDFFFAFLFLADGSCFYTNCRCIKRTCGIPLSFLSLAQANGIWITEN